MNYVKINLAEKVSDDIVSSLSRKELETIAWDIIFNELSSKSWEDLFTFAEEYSPDLLDDFPKRLHRITPV